MFPAAHYQVSFHCSVCGLGKKSEDEMENHLKMDHLKWLPFECPQCGEKRALESQLRDHIFSNRHGDPSKFLYSDDPIAKRKLLQWMKSSRVSLDVSANSPAPLNAMTPTTEVLPPSMDCYSSSSGGRNPTATSTPPPSLFDRPIKTEIDLRSPPKNKRQISEEQDGALAPLTDTSNGGPIQQKLHFVCPPQPVTAKKLKTERVWSSCGQTEEEDIVEVPIDDDPRPTRPPRLPQIIVDGKVQCRKCEAPVVASASMKRRHTMAHLANDYQVHRYFCRFSGCDTKNYRKDAMENHQVKVHGKIDESKIEDMIDFLSDTIAEVHEDLFSSSEAEAINPVPDDSSSSSRSNPTAKTQLVKQRFSRTSVLLAQKNVVASRQCQLCDRTISAKNRSVHVMYHLFKDKAIGRYQCGLCDYGRDRAEAIRRHLDKEHNGEGTVEDKFIAYQEEIAAQSDECFRGQDMMMSAPVNRREPYQPREKVSPSCKWTDLTCKICGVTMSSRGRSQHVYAHLAKDKGIDRYKCSKCDFKSHARQFIRNHSKKEHDGTDTAIDKFLEFKDEIDAQHIECFGGQFSAISRCEPRHQISATRQPLSSTAKKNKKIDKEARAARLIKRLEHSVGANSETAQKSEKTESLKSVAKKAMNDYTCRTCLEENVTDMAKHALKHVDKPLFKCPECDFNRQIEVTGVKKHIKAKHPNSALKPIDNRTIYAVDIEKTRHVCFPSHFSPVAVRSTNPSFDGDEEFFIVEKSTCCSICGQTLRTPPTTRMPQYRHKLVRNKCWCGRLCGLGSEKGDWQHCEECVNKLFFCEDLDLWLSRRF